MFDRTAIATAAAAALLLLTPAPARSQDWRTVTSMRQYQGEDALAVSVEYGAGKMNVGPAERDVLYKATLRYDASSFKPVTAYAEGRLRAGIEGGSIKGRNMKSGRLDLALTPRVPLDLDLKFGATRAQMEFGGLSIRRAHIQTGASETDIRVSRPNTGACSNFKLEVGAADFHAGGLGNLNCESIEVHGGVGDITLDFNGAWRVDSSLDVDMGLGALTLRVPRGLGVSVTKNGFLASFDSEGLVKRGSVYYSENWQNAGNRLSVNIDAAFGSIRVVWVEPEGQFKRAQR